MAGPAAADNRGRMGPLHRREPVHAFRHTGALAASGAAGATAWIADRPIPAAVRLDDGQFPRVAAAAARRALHDIVFTADVRRPAGGTAARREGWRRAAGRDRSRLSRGRDRDASRDPRIPADRPRGDRRRRLRRGLRDRHATASRPRFPRNHARLDADRRHRAVDAFLPWVWETPPSGFTWAVM